LRLAYGADSSMLSDTAALIMNAGILDLAGTVAHEEIVLSTTINGTVAIERSAGSSIIHLNTITRNAGSLRISADNIATTDNLNVNGILGGWFTAGGSWATNSTNGPDGLIVGLTTFDQDIDRLAGGTGTQTIVNTPTDNVRIIEAGSTANPVTLAAPGTTTIYTLLQGATGGEAVVDIGSGNVLRIATGGILQPDGSSALTFTTNGTLTAGAADNTAATMFLQNQDSTGSQALTIGAVIADNGTSMVDVRTTGPGTTIFAGANTYTGSTLIGSGILAIGNGGSTGTLGSGDVIVEGSAILAFNRSDTGLVVSNAVTGSGSVVQNGSGTTTLAAAAPVSTLNFVAANGTLATSADNAINTTGSLVFGATTGSTSVGTVDLTNGSATVGSLLVRTDTTSANQILIGPGKTLTVNGEFTVGPDLDASATALTISGGGSLVVNSSGANFQIGGATGATNENSAVLDMSGLGSFTANLDAGIFKLGDINTGTTSDPSSAKLAINNTITARSIKIGDGSGGSSTHTLTLGSGTNVFNADIFNIGSALSGVRSSGVVQFDAGDTTGTFKLRGSDGQDDSRALVNMVNTIGNTGSTMNATLNLASHTADLRISTLTMATRTSNSGGTNATLTFDRGTLDISTLVMAGRSGSGTGGATATVNLGDSDPGGTPSVIIGSIEMGTNSGSGGTVNADLNVSGGSVIIGSGSGTAINMASAGTGRTVNSTIDLTGGSVTLTGDIVRTGGAGTENTTLTLDGATLDMSGHRIGTATEAITFVAASGTLQNLAELNGGGGLTKTTAGLLVMDGVNTYSGPTTVSAGTLQFAKQTAFYNNTQSSWTATNLVVESGATAAFNVGGTGEFTAADLDVIQPLGTASGGFKSGSSLGIDTTNATGTFTYATAIADPNGGANSLGLTKLGTGTLELTAASTYSGPTRVEGGVLLVNNSTGSATGTGAVTVNATLGGTGTVGGDLIVNSGGVVAPGVAAEGLLTIGGDLTVSSGGTLLMQLGGATLNDESSIRGHENNLGSVNSTIIDGWEAANTVSLHDHLVSNGATAPDFDGVLKLDSTFLNGYTPEFGDVFDLLDWAAVSNMTGTASFDFSGVVLGTGLALNTDLFASHGIIVVVPEPSRAVLLLVALSALALRRRRIA
jgi:autotransporter-associated beta strand protein